jgi:hypothetical protein
MKPSTSAMSIKVLHLKKTSIEFAFYITKIKKEVDIGVEGLYLAKSVAVVILL